MSSFGKCNVNTEDIWETKNPENGESESGFIMSLFCLSYIINLKLGRASYAITNEICNESFLALENLVTQPPQPTPSSPNFRSFSADLCALICFDWNFFKHFAKIHDENCHLEDKSFLLK